MRPGMVMPMAMKAARAVPESRKPAVSMPAAARKPTEVAVPVEAATAFFQARVARRRRSGR